jgi:hypothetical protein
MPKRHPSPRLAKIHRNYTVEEISVLFSIHKNTVRSWIKSGLPTNDDRRPLLILGRDLVAFLQFKRVKNKRPCQMGEIYCVRCRSPQEPAGRMAEYQAFTKTSGNIVGICPTCESLMYQRISYSKLVKLAEKLEISKRMLCNT